jgi:hypothetical protein
VAKSLTHILRVVRHPLVAVLATLSTVGCKSVERRQGEYERKAMMSEAREALEGIYENAQAHYHASASAARYPTPSTPLTPPPGTCCKSEGKCPSRVEVFAGEPWPVLLPHHQDGTIIDTWFRYSLAYHVAEDGQSFVATASGDLDCDGQFSTLELRGDPSLPAELDLGDVDERWVARDPLE